MAGSGDFISDADIQLIKEKLVNVQEQSLEFFQQNIKVISYLTYLLEKAGIHPIIGSCGRDLYSGPLYHYGR